MNNYSYVLVQQDDCSSNSEWRIHGVFSSREHAIIKAFKLLVKESLLPWKQSFIRRSSDPLTANQLENVTSLSDYHIEEWSVNGERKGTIFVGHRLQPYQHMFQILLQSIQKNNANTEHVLQTWKEFLDNDIVPDDLRKLIT